ncbi:MAG: DUF6273 domain-containing protein [Candidatus Cloacimonetes bacterium]|nr:DUF6273 domain-containing protein [Candidatus Cloacimonadota bacterium]
MKIKNKLFLILLTVFIMLSFGSCSDKKTTEPDNIKVGDIIQFGTYKWRVLDIQSGKALVVSENILEFRLYHHEMGAITWADCSLRDYLNGEFYNSSAFSNADRNRIVQVTNVNENNQWHDTNGGTNTLDMIFLLSIAEVVKYFGDSEQLANRPSGVPWINDEYNNNRIATFNGSVVWWSLRSPGLMTYLASNVHYDGYINLTGNHVYSFFGGVRPALWLSL